VLDFQNASAMLRITMTDKLHYPDLFKTINIPETEKPLALEAHNLFDVANGVVPWNPDRFTHMSKFIDSESASQIFWNFEDDANHLYDRLALTAMRGGLTVALEHRNFTNPAVSVRKTLIMSQGVSKIFTTDLQGRGGMDGGSKAESEIITFKQQLLETTARLGLYGHIKRLETDQNESSSAILANAA
jgi:hypothetical protein